MTTKTIYLPGKAHYLRPYFLDTGDNLPDGSDQKRKIMATEGIYSARVILPFDNRDDAEEHLNSLGIPTDGMMGNLLKKEVDSEGGKIITYKVTRPHFVPNMPNKDTGEMGVTLGHPKVVKFVKDEDGNFVFDENGKRKVEPWDEDTPIGNGSDIILRLNVWIGDKAKRIRWDVVCVENHVQYERPEGDEGF